MASVALACAAMCMAAGESPVPKQASVIDHGLRPKAYPVYLGMGAGLGWRDLYNQDEAGAYYLEREFGFRNVKLDLRITQAFIGDAAHPTGRLGLRYPKGGRLVTGTQPEWYSTWCRYDDRFPGMLDVVIGKGGLKDTAPEFECGSLGAIGFVRARWSHKGGTVTATFLMLPDDDRLFCEIGVKPKTRRDRVAVSLCCWPTGKSLARTATGSSPELKYRSPYTLPPDDATVLFADPEFDPVGKTKQGVCAITYFPDECESVTVERTFPVLVTLNLTRSRGNECAYAHFVLYELLHRRGDAAFAYVSEKEAETLAIFESMAGLADPRFVSQREAGIAEVRQKLRVFDEARKAIQMAEPEAAATDGLPRLSDRVLNLRWADFYRREALRHLASGDWHQALMAVRIAHQFLAKHE